MIDWSEYILKVERSETFWPWGQNAVNIFRRSGGKWILALPDFSPSILERCKFPKLLCKAAAMTAKDGKARIVGEKIETKPTLVRRRK
jgi:hypothetical protein